MIGTICRITTKITIALTIWMSVFSAPVTRG
jgi:hypothetical protein